MDTWKYAVTTYGANPNGADAAGTTAAINACIAAAVAATKQRSVTGATTSYSRPKIFFPEGVYLINSSIELGASMFVIGDDAILVGSAGVDIFKLIQTAQVTIQSMTFQEGRRGIYVSNGGATNWAYDIVDCEFVSQSAAGVATDNQASAGVLNVRDSVFYQAGGGSAFNLQSCDLVSIRDCTIAQSTVEALVLGESTSVAPRVHLRDTPITPLDGSAAFIKQNGGILHCQGVRFGGEAARTCVETYATGGELIVQDCAAYSTGKSNFKFYAIPALTRIRDNIGTGLGGLYFDATIPSADIRTLGNSAQVDYDGSYGQVYGINLNLMQIETDTSSLAAFSSAYSSNAYEVAPEAVNSSQLIRVVWPTSDNAYWVDSVETSNSNASGTQANPYTQYRVLVTATANGGLRSDTFTNALTGLANGLYTLCVYFEAFTSPCWGYLVAGNTTRQFYLPVGPRVVCVPFQIGAHTNVRSIGAGIRHLANGASGSYGLLKIFSGHVKQNAANTVVYGPDAPTVNGRWWIGDRVINTDSDIDTTEYFLCTTSGTLAPAWAGTTGYSVGNFVANDTTRIYVCTTAGTSAGAGGPTGTGTAITDGSCVWRYMDTKAAFTAIAP